MFCYNAIMNNLLTITLADFEPAAPKVAEKDYKLREAARAVLLDSNNEVCLMHVTKYGYHKLPGGGIDSGESKEEALARELMEEIGCTAIIEQVVGQITEYRPFYGQQKQLSYCYIARQIGELEEPQLEQDELDEGMIQIKARDIQHAINLLKHDKPENLEGKYIQKRDLEFLRHAQRLLVA